MNEHDVIQWFDEYLEAFAACGRGERETSSLLAYYGVPILFTTAGGCLTVTSADQVVATVKQQIDAMRAAGYARSVTIEHAVTVLNACSALYRGTFSRRSGGGGEISRLTATYLVTDGPSGRRISMLAVH